MPFANDGGGGGARCALAFVLGVLAPLHLKRSRIEPADAEVVGLLLLLEVGCGRRRVSVLCGGGTGTWSESGRPNHISSAAERLRVIGRWAAQEAARRAEQHEMAVVEAAAVSVEAVVAVPPAPPIS